MMLSELIHHLIHAKRQFGDKEVGIADSDESTYDDIGKVDLADHGRIIIVAKDE